MSARTFSLLLATGLLACTSAPIPVHFQEICFPPEPDDNGTCVYEVKCSNSLAKGRLKVDLETTLGSLWMPVEMNNQMPDNGDESSLRVNTHDAYVTEFRMSYTLDGAGAGSAVSRQDVTVLASGSTSALIKLIPETIGQTMSAPADPPRELLITVRAAGKLRSGDDFVSDPYVIPVEVCRGCIANPGYPCCPQAGQTAVCKPPTATGSSGTGNLTLTVSKAGTGTGTVTSDTGGINCGSTCSGSFASNATVTLTATTSGGSTFAGWSGCTSSSGTTCIVVMTTNTTVSATFN